MPTPGGRGGHRRSGPGAAAAEAVRRLLVAAQRRRHRRQPDTRHDRPRAAPQPAAGRASRGRVWPVNPQRRPRRLRSAPWPASSTSPTTSTSPSSPCRRTPWPRWWRSAVASRCTASWCSRRASREAGRRGRRAGGGGAAGRPVVGDPRWWDRTASASSTRTQPCGCTPRSRTVVPRRGPGVAAVRVGDGRRGHHRPGPRARGIGISSFVALGNRADVSGNDLLQYWEGDEQHRRRVHVHRVVRQRRGTSAAWPAASAGPSRWWP